MLWWREAINLVRKYEFLYDMKSKDYKDDEMNDNNMDRDCKGDDDGPGKFHQEFYFALKQEHIFINMVNYHFSLWSQRSFLFTLVVIIEIMISLGLNKDS